MTSKASAIQIQVHRVVALIAEALSARMTTPAVIEPYSFPLSFAHRFDPATVENVHMMKTHIGAGPPVGTLAGRRIEERFGAL